MDIQAELNKLIEELPDPMGIRDKPKFHDLETELHAIIRRDCCSPERALVELRKLHGL